MASFLPLRLFSEKMAHAKLVLSGCQNKFCYAVTNFEELMKLSAIVRDKPLTPALPLLLPDKVLPRHWQHTSVINREFHIVANGGGNRTCRHKKQFELGLNCAPASGLPQTLGKFRPESKRCILSPSAPPPLFFVHPFV